MAKMPPTSIPEDCRETKFGKLKILQHGGYHIRPNGKRISLWLCQCDCGKTTKCLISNLRHGYSKSCGCSRVQLPRLKFWKGCGELSGRYWSSIKRNAKIRNIEFSISIEYAWNLFLSQQRRCTFTNNKLVMEDKIWKNGQRQKTSQTASLDRIDSTKGYIVGNVQWVHKTINNMKSSLSQEEFLHWCQLVVTHVHTT